jgi:hypothetical protein
MKTFVLTRTSSGLYATDAWIAATSVSENTNPDVFAVCASAVNKIGNTRHPQQVELAVSRCAFKGSLRFTEGHCFCTLKARKNLAFVFTHNLVNAWRHYFPHTSSLYIRITPLS